MGKFTGHRAFVAIVLMLAVSVATSMITPATVRAAPTTTDCTTITGKAYFGPPSVGWENQCQMVNDPNIIGYGLDRETIVLDPGVGKFLTRDQLIANAPYYNALGFTDQFLWYAPLTQVDPTSNSKWSGCYAQYRPTLTFCTHVDTTPTKTISQDLTQNRTLDAISDGIDYISLACGNFNVPVQPDMVYPTIYGMKFDDANRDEVQDDGESGVGGVTFELFRDSSQVATTTSAPDGTFSFPLDQSDEGPGTYTVQESVPSGWENTTGLSQYVTVNEGVGDATYSVKFGDIQGTALTALPAPVNAVEGQSFSGTVATFTDADELDSADSATNDTATINWGDGSSSTGAITSNGGGSYAVSGTHTYADESTPTIQVSISDPDDLDGAATTISSTASVADAALSNATGATITATEGQAVSNIAVATFADDNPGATAADFTMGGGSVTIDWGDGSTSLGTVTQTATGQFSVSGNHTYADEGSYTTVIRIADDGGSTATASGSAKIGDASLAATGVADSAICSNSISQIVATFADDNPGATAADFTMGGGSVTIDWGDGSTSMGTVTQTGSGQFSVSGTHAYAVLGPYTMTITIVDDGGSTAQATTHVITCAYSSGGSFVIGQNNTVGASVTFWSAQWDKVNTVSPGSDAFKGFETSTQTPTCPDTWTSGTGNSVMPPDTIPTYMAVIVASSVTQSGSTISGDIQKVVVVRTDPGYGSNPGHAGTGTIVATLCG